MLANARLLANKECKIYFFELPMDSSITGGALMKYHRDYFRQAAIENNYSFIPVDSSVQYHTSDALHLIKADAKVYSKYLWLKMR